VTALAPGEGPLASELLGECRLGGATAARAAVATRGAVTAVTTAVATAAVTLALAGLVVVMVVVSM
jgi:hypothetical protein